MEMCDLDQCCGRALETTFDWSACLKPKMPWKLDICDISMELPLDYSLHTREELCKKGVWKVEEEDIVRIALKGITCAEEPKLVCDVMQSAMHAANCGHEAIYNTYVVGLAGDPQEKIPDLVKFECGPFVWVVFNMHGNWPAIFRKSDVDDSNYLTYAQKGSNVFVWDNNRGMARADY